MVDDLLIFAVEQLVYIPLVTQQILHLLGKEHIVDDEFEPKSCCIEKLM
jgi:hypothetical protein